MISIISTIHLSTGHKGETKSQKNIMENYANIPRQIMSEFTKQCQRCTEYLKRKETAGGIVIKPIVVSDLSQSNMLTSKVYWMGILDLLCTTKSICLERWSQKLQRKCVRIPNQFPRVSCTPCHSQKNGRNLQIRY